MIIESTIEIERPIDEVFEVATCRRRCVVWRGSIVESKMDSDEPIHVGSTFYNKVQFGGQIYEFQSVVTELAPPHHLAFKSSSTFIFVSHTFAPTEQGSTFRITLEIKGGPLTELFEDPSLLKASMKTSLQQDLQQLKLFMESNVDLWALTPA